MCVNRPFLEILSPDRAQVILLTLAFYILPYRFNRCSACTEQTEYLTPECIFHGLTPLYLSSFFLYRRICIYELIVLFQYTTSGKGEQVFLLYYRDFFEQICSDVQFISPPEEVGEFLSTPVPSPISSA